MKFFKLLLIVLPLSMSACSQYSESDYLQAMKVSAALSPEAHQYHHHRHSHYSQSFTSGNYKLELLSHKDNDGINLEFCLQEREQLKQVNSAQITAQIQLNNGQQETIPFEFRQSTNHYHAIIPKKFKKTDKLVIAAQIKINSNETILQNFQI